MTADLRTAAQAVVDAWGGDARHWLHDTGLAINALRAELARHPVAAPAAAEDAERLDWLEKNDPQLTRGLDRCGNRYWFVGMDFAINGKTLREAIDAARAQPQGGASHG